jgi:hypothetical protein
VLPLKSGLQQIDTDNVLLGEFAAVDELKLLTAKCGKTAIHAAPGLEQPGCRYRTVGFRKPTEVIENLEAPGLGNQRCRYGRDRRHLRPSRRYNIAALPGSKLSGPRTIG